MRSSLYCFGKTVIILFLCVSFTQAAPAEIGYQGRLLGADDEPLNGIYDVTFRLFDAPETGTLLWEESQLVTTDGGLFSARLGESTIIDFEVFGVRPDSVWLEIQVGDDPPMLPRTPLSATPLSAVSMSVDGDIKTQPGAMYLDPDDDGDGLSMSVTDQQVSMSLNPGGADVGGPATYHSVADTGIVSNWWWAGANSSEPNIKTKVDSSEAYESKAAAERAFDAVITVEDGVRESPTDSVRGVVMSRVITGGGADTATAYKLESSPAGGRLQLFSLYSSYWLDGNVDGDYSYLAFIKNGIDSTMLFDGDGNGKLAGQLRLGIDEILATLTVGGDICATGAIGACSDLRYKKNVATIDDPLDKIKAMRGVSYEWDTEQYPGHKFETDPQVGVIAQEVRKIAPEVVTKTQSGMLSVDYGKLTPILIEALKEQQQTIERQESEIGTMKQQLSELEATVTRLATQSSATTSAVRVAATE